MASESSDGSDRSTNIRFWWKTATRINWFSSTPSPQWCSLRRRSGVPRELKPQPLCPQALRHVLSRPLLSNRLPRSRPSPHREQPAETRSRTRLVASGYGLHPNKTHLRAGLLAPRILEFV